MEENIVQTGTVPAGEPMTLGGAVYTATYNPTTTTTVTATPGGEAQVFTVEADWATQPVPVDGPWDSVSPPPYRSKSETRAQFDRMKGAKWFEKAKTTDVMILGQGGIGSWLTLLISRFGCIVYTWDMDKFEAHNMSGQLVRQEDMGKPKTVAVSEICREFNDGHTQIYVNGEFDANAFPSHTMLCGFDNMDARKLAFKKWKEYREDSKKAYAEEPLNPYVYNPDNFFFQDGRLTAEQLQIFNVPGNRPDLIEKYEKECLFEDKEGHEGDCTFKQTSHAAAMIAAHMTGFYTNWLTNIVTGDMNYAKLPFKYEYIIPYNLTMQDYVNT